MITVALLLGFGFPDSTSAMTAVTRCDRPQVRAFIRAEPRRRSEFAAAAYAEQRAIAGKRAGLLRSPSGLSAGAALAQLDNRRKALDDARTIESGWRELFDQLRADYIANCTAGTRNAED